MFSNYNKWTPNINGNPWMDNEIIPFWNYNKKEFDDFKNKLIKHKIEFVAFEWNYFKFFKELDYANVELITCIREPHERFISNMFIDKYDNGHLYATENIK
jgi:hypothetical protein